jgi:hypothetical protein
MKGKFLRLTRLLTLSLSCITAAGTNYVSAQTAQILDDTAKGPQEIPTGPRVFMPDQARLTFNEAWKEFRESHTYNLDGEFEIGGRCEDTPETLDAFYIYLSNNRLTKTIHFKQRCSLCGGSGKIGGLAERKDNCQNCFGSGREEAAKTYSFLVLPINVPKKPETPRQKQEKALREKIQREIIELELLSSAGNVDACLSLGKKYSTGYHFIARDLAKSEKYFLKAMTLGSMDGIIGYLEAREYAFKGSAKDAMLIYALRLALNDHSTRTPAIKPSYTDHLIAQALSERICLLISKSGLSQGDLDLKNLRRIAQDREIAVPINNSNTPSLSPIILEFFSSEMPPRISQASLTKIRAASLKKTNGAFGMLADFAHNGEVPIAQRSAQSAHIYYMLENLTSGDPYALECARAIEDSVDVKTTEFFINEYRHLLYNSTVNETMLLAIDEIHTLNRVEK